MDFIKTKTIVKSGQPGTKRLYNIYGEDLICVRYKYDYKRRRRLKTIELIVDEKSWSPSPDDSFSNQTVYVRIHYNEIELRQKVKNAGGVWNKDKRLWKLQLQSVLDLDIEDRIIGRISIYRNN